MMGDDKKKICAREFIDNWKNINDDKIFFNFFRYWMILNRLYTVTPNRDQLYISKYKSEFNCVFNNNEKSCHDKERKKLFCFIVYCLSEFEKKEKLGVFYDQIKCSSQHFEVQKGADNHSVDNYKNLLEMLKDDKYSQTFKKIVKTFLKIYRARCNLFHGEKDPKFLHDRDIIKKSNSIMERFLEMYQVYIEDFVIFDCFENE